MTAELRYSSDSAFGCVHDEVIFVGTPRRPGCRRHADKSARNRRRQQEQASTEGYRRHFDCHRHSTIMHTEIKQTEDSQTHSITQFGFIDN